MSSSGDDCGVEAKQQAAQCPYDDALHQVKVEFARHALRLQITRSAATLIHNCERRRSEQRPFSRLPFESSLLAPDSQFVSIGIGKVEAPSARKLERLNHNLSARLDDLAASFFQGPSVQHDQRAAFHRLSAHGEASAQTPVVKAGVIWAEVGEAPAKHCAIEALGGLDIGGWKLDVVHLEVVVSLIHVIPRIAYPRARLAHRHLWLLRVAVHSCGFLLCSASRSCRKAVAPA